MKRFLLIIALIALCLVPLCASAYTMDDIYWSIAVENGERVLYLSGFKSFPSDGSNDLIVDVDCDRVVLCNSINYSDQFRTVRVKNMYLPVAKSYEVQDYASYSNSLGQRGRNSAWYTNIIIPCSIDQWPNLDAL